MCTYRKTLSDVDDMVLKQKGLPMPEKYEPDHSDIMDLLYEAFEDYFAKKISETEYIARINVCMSAEHQRRERAKDPESYDASMLNRAVELGLVPVNSANQ